MPPILAVNAAVFTPEALKFWQDGRNSTFLKPTVEVRGEVMGVEDPQGAVYELRVWLALLLVFVGTLTSITGYGGTSCCQR